MMRPGWYHVEFRWGRLLLATWVLAVLLPRIWLALAVPEPLESQAAGRVGGALLADGWLPVAARPLLADSTLRAVRFRRNGCDLEVAVLPMDPVLAEVVKAALGQGVRYVWGGAAHAGPPGLRARLALLGRQARWRLSLGPRPDFLMLAVAVTADRPGPACPLPAVLLADWHP